MKLTKKLEAEIKQVMDTYWNSYLHGDLEAWASFLTENYRNIGTTEEEVWNSKQEIVDYTNSVIHQLKGLAEIRDKTYQIVPTGPYIMVHEYGNMYLKSEENWVFYSKLRLSSLLQKTEQGWKILHQHGSYPDTKTEEGETFAFDKISKENLELKEAVKRRTVELEHKTRELEIETSLERVRAVAMSMQKPNDLLSVSKSLFAELKLLGFHEVRNALINTFNDEKSFLLDYDYSDFLGGHITTIPYNRHPLIENHVKQIRKATYAFAETIVTENELESWIEGRRANGEPEDPQLENISALYYYFYSTGPAAIGLSTYSALPVEKRELLKRFRNVFELAYRRYADIEKAEANAKEAQIEAALEKVRSSSLAMHTSSELEEVVKVVFANLRSLGIKKMDAANINIFHEGTKEFDLWAAAAGQDYTTNFKLPYLNHPIVNDFFHAVENGEVLHKKVYDYDEKNRYFNYMFENSDNKSLPEERKKLILDGAAYSISAAIANHSSLHIYNYNGEVFSDEDDEILIRFSRVFDQAYTRFLDLQKAEAQAKEAKIEASLERVRAKAMAMHHSGELDEVLAVLFDQFDILGIESMSTHITLIDIENNTFTFRETGKGGHQSYGEQKVPIDSMDIWKEAADKWRTSEPLSLNRLHFPKEMLPQVWQVFHESFASMPEGAKIVPEDYPDGIYHTAGNCKFGYIGMNQTKKATEEEEQIVLKFATEFGRLYQRFLDLKKAEAQAREAQIEAALERVRSRTMAMHESQELLDVIKVVSEQLSHLNFEFDNVSLGITNKNYDIDFWMAAKGQQACLQIHAPYIDNPLVNRLKEARNNGVDFFADVCTPDENRAWIWHVIKNAGENVFSERTKTFLLNSPGYSRSTVLTDSINFFIGNYAARPYSDEENTIFERFANVIGQSYTRFLDLQKAEEQAKEAHIEAALEKVRSRTLAMQKSDELADTAAVLFKQLIGLGIAPNRLYISIIKDDRGNAEFWITDEDGSKVSFAYEANLNANPTFQKMQEGWKQQKESLTVDMDGEELQAYLGYLNSINVPFKGGLEQKRRVQNIAYFSKGFIGMASPEEQPPETVQLLQRFAYVFNLTYTRFSDLQLAEAHALKAEEDLIKLQTEKRRAEDALNELQLTQKQLIQSEKMASLGELTAGIAHEIQNPLNFVNNFSEISKELLDEMKAALDSGDREEANAIAGNIVQNLEKINHHGKRADAIVKGMLQHSRSSGNQKEATDINTLTDEYLRLAYHGLRAKEKSFNATLQTDYGENAGTVNVIPQDIGRVILNLITNAFYAVNEKSKGSTSGYQPTVWVSTKKDDDAVLVLVRDNGNGIPLNIIDKIFQPFFTTKPTGQGTGLGLSLAYDIVKAHSGEITLQTKEGEGTTFIIHLPIT